MVNHPGLSEIIAPNGSQEVNGHIHKSSLLIGQQLLDVQDGSQCILHQNMRPIMHPAIRRHERGLSVECPLTVLCNVQRQLGNEGVKCQAELIIWSVSVNENQSRFSQWMCENFLIDLFMAPPGLLYLLQFTTFHVWTGQREDFQFLSEIDFGLNVSVGWKRWTSIGCRKRPFHGPAIV